MPETFRVLVTPAGRGYLAESAAFAISAGGSTPMDAIEKARSMASEVLRDLHAKRPAWITACIQSSGTLLFITRPFSATFSDEGLPLPA
jgi:hypothetical protein